MGTPGVAVTGSLSWCAFACTETSILALPSSLPLPALSLFLFLFSHSFSLSFPLSLPSLIASSLPVSPPPLPKSPFPGFSIRGALWVSFFLRLLFCKFLKRIQSRAGSQPRGGSTQHLRCSGQGWGWGESPHSSAGAQGPRVPIPHCSNHSY